jgi:hypothetical protein
MMDERLRFVARVQSVAFSPMWLAASSALRVAAVVVKGHTASPHTIRQTRHALFPMKIRSEGDGSCTHDETGAACSEFPKIVPSWRARSQAHRRSLIREIDFHMSPTAAYP